MLFSRPDIHFAADDSHRFLPWLIGVMACLSALLLCLGISVNSWIIDHHGHYNSLTVNIPAHSDNLPDKITRVRDALKKTPGVVDVAQIEQAKLQDMLKPWLGSNAGMDGLPLPTVFDVTFDAKAPAIDYNALEKNLSLIAPGVEVDAHERWVAAFSDFSIVAQCLIGILALLILFFMGVMIAFISRTSLKLHSKTVYLLHSVGAEDIYITRQFQQEAFRLVLPGAFLGCITAGMIYWAIGLYLAALPVSLMPSLVITRSHLLLIMLMPLGCAVAAWLVARFSVIRQLQHVL